jgi:hypothetical protein
MRNHGFKDQVCLRKERTSSGIFGKPLSWRSQKKVSGHYGGFGPSETKEETANNRLRTINVETLTL